MQAPLAHDEAALEALLRRIAPEECARWEPATPEQIAELEACAGRPLPPFYRWFLSRMGQQSGDFAPAYVDYGVAPILEIYREGDVPRACGMLLVGINADDIGKGHLFYDLDWRVGSDCVVGDMPFPDAEDDLTRLYVRGERVTLHDLIAHTAFFRWRVRKCARGCSAYVEAPEGADVNELFTQRLLQAGFHEPVRCGPYYRIFDRADAAMVSWQSPSIPKFRSFQLGGASVEALRAVLDVLSSGGDLTLKVDAWET